MRRLKTQKHSGSQQIRYYRRQTSETTIRRPSAAAAAGASAEEEEGEKLHTGNENGDTRHQLFVFVLSETNQLMRTATHGIIIIFVFLLKPCPNAWQR